MHPTATPYPYLSSLQHEGQPHAFGICVPVYVDVLHGRQAVFHADSGSTLLFEDESVKSNLLPSGDNEHYDPYFHLHV